MLHIAIIGGGIGGLALARGLLKFTHITFDVYEGKPSFAERGAAVGLSINALSALKAIDPEVYETIARAGAVGGGLAVHKIGDGGDIGATVLEKDVGYSVRRDRWLQELLDPIPQERLHSSKKLDSIEEKGRQVILKFTDGSSEKVDAVVGCDGIHSMVRGYILGLSPTAPPNFAGFWDCRNVVSNDRLLKEFGDLLDPTKYDQIAVTGLDTFLLTQAVDGGKACGIAAGGVTDASWDQTQWKIGLTAEFLREKFATWEPRTRDAIISCFMDQPDPCIFSQWESGICETFARHSVCIMGDAAHATTPWQGAGAGQALEDAAVLCSLFGALSNSSDIPMALKAYDSVRRTRSQQVIISSRETGRISSGQYGIGLETLKSLYQGRWDFIFNIDMSQHIREALASFERFKG